MIQTHEFNSAWWGHPVGIVTDRTFFERTAAEREHLLAPYAWVEYKDPVVGGPSPTTRMSESGFVCVDTQIRFRVRLKSIVEAMANPALHFADATVPFTIEPANLKPFRHERFFHLPGITAEKIAARYALWANRLIRENPQWCLELSMDGQVQGWFCARPTGSMLELTLAMLHTNSRLSGLELYQGALISFATRGARLGSASFSAGNTDVLNIYARLGAHFLPPVSCWLWY